MNRPAKNLCLSLAAALMLPLLASCSLPGAAFRSLGSLLQVSATPDDAAAREAAFDGLRKIHEAEDLTPPAAGSTR